MELMKQIRGGFRSRPQYNHIGGVLSRIGDDELQHRVGYGGGAQPPGNREEDEKRVDLGGHIENLPFLQAVMKETLQLHPPIPKDTQLFVNAWAIG
ncbi:hypothetical protein ACS0TY_003073 [Phlomoides rotata]